MTASVREPGQRSDGLVAFHCYSLIACKEVDGKRLVLLRNPWGNGKEWNGAWSDGSKEWKEHANIARALDYAPAPDGLFWMEWTDFHKTFTDVNVCPTDMRVAGEKTKRGRVKQYPTWHRKDPKEDANKEKAILRGVMVVAGVIFAFNICDTWQRRPKT